MTKMRLGVSMAIVGAVVATSCSLHAGDRFSKLADAKGLILISPNVDQKCGVVTLPRIKTKVGRLLLWEIRNSCATYPLTGEPIEIKNFVYQGAHCDSKGINKGKPAAVEDLFACKKIAASLVWGTPTAFAGCVVKTGVTPGCYKYDIYIEGTLALDPELEIAN